MIELRNAFGVKPIELGVACVWMYICAHMHTHMCFSCVLAMEGRRGEEGRGGEERGEGSEGSEGPTAHSGIGGIFG